MSEKSAARRAIHRQELGALEELAVAPHSELVRRFSRARD
jgi:hypothetical protein